MGQIKRAIPVVAISSLFIIVFNILAFVLSNRHDANFWCGYIFITLSWICLIGIELLTASKRDIAQSLFLNAPGLFMSIGHLAIQTLFGIAVMAIPSYSVKLSVCVEIVVFAIYLGIIGVLEIYKKNYSRRSGE